jgi:hypothetical protein
MAQFDEEFGRPNAKLGTELRVTMAKPLTQDKIDFIAACYKEGKGIHATAKLVPCSGATVWWYYQCLANGIHPKAYDFRRDKPIRRRFPKPPPIPKVRKLLNDDKRFYHSTFEPS